MIPVNELSMAPRDGHWWGVDAVVGKARFAGWTAGAEAQIREATLRAMGQPAVRDRLQEAGFEPRQARMP